MRIAQISDIHLDDFTEPFFLRHVVDRVNRIKPDAMFLTGDFVTATLGLEARSKAVWDQRFARGAAWQCANILTGLECKALYAVLGNHDFGVGADEVTAALASQSASPSSEMPTSRLSAQAAESGWPGWMIRSTGIPDPSWPSPRRYAICPMNPSFCSCHAPDYADHLLAASGRPGR